MLHPALKCCTWTSLFLCFIGKHHCSFSQISGRRPNLEITAAKCQILFTQDKKSQFSPQWLDAAHCSCDQQRGATLLWHPTARGLRAGIPKEIHLIAFPAHAFVSFYPFFFFPPKNCLQNTIGLGKSHQAVSTVPPCLSCMWQSAGESNQTSQQAITSFYFSTPKIWFQILFIPTSKGKFVI